MRPSEAGAARGRPRPLMPLALNFWLHKALAKRLRPPAENER